MILNHEQIKNSGILKGDDPANYSNASYNLSVGTIVNAKGQTLAEYKIPPQGMIMVVSKEIFSLKADIIGYTTVKNSLSISGILAINIGIVDPHYKGPISSVLINFGKSEFQLKKGDEFMRMTFHNFLSVQNDVPLRSESRFIDERHYIRERRKDSMILGDKFLYLHKEIKKFKDQTKVGIIEYFAKLAVVVSIILAALSFTYTTYTSRNDADVIQKYQSSKFITDRLKFEDSIIIQLKKDISEIKKKNNIASK